MVRCSWLLNPNQPPRQNTRVTVSNGTVVDISDVPADEHSFIQAIAVTPQFVNAHTHLEFSKLSEPVQPATPFPGWIRSVIRYRMQNPADDFVAQSVQAGLQESATMGVGLIGEITTSDAGLESLGRTVGQGVSFREFIGFAKTSIEDQLAKATCTAQLNSSQDWTTGLSPHAPYSVHPELFEGIVDLAVDSELPVAMHLAETRDEIELLSQRSGRFVDFLQQLGLWDDSVLGANRSVLPYLQKLAQCQHSLAIHCNYLTNDELKFLGKNRHVAVVYCPRTHAWFGHQSHPIERLTTAGATVVLGTDSRASNPDLCIWKELQYVANLPKAKPIWELLPMVTTTAAAALGKATDPFKVQVGQPFRAVSLSCQCDQLASLNSQLISSTCRPGEVFN